MNACLSFTVVSFFYAVFVAAQFQHHRTDTAFALHRTFTSAMDSVGPRVLDSVPAGFVASSTTKTLSSVSSWEDVLEWLELSYAPQIWQESARGRGYLRNFNKVIGGLRIRRQNRVTADCPGFRRGREELVRLYNMSCFSSQSDQSADVSLSPTPLKTDKRGFHNYWIDIHQNYSEIRQHIGHLRNSAWLSDATAVVDIEGAFYNGQKGIFVVASVQFYMSSVGHLKYHQNSHTLPELVYENGVGTFSLWADVFVVATLLMLFCTELIQVKVAWSEGRLKQHIRNPYKLLTVGIIGMGLGITLFFITLSNNVEDMSTRVVDVMKQPVPAGLYSPGGAYSNWAKRHIELDSLVSDLVYHAAVLRYSQLATFWYSLVLMLKLFEGFEANRHLAPVIKTMKISMPNVTHFLIIFGLFFFNFLLGARLIFGHKLKEWASMLEAVNAGFRALMGDFDQKAIYNIAPIAGTCWFWLYMILIYLILMNVFIAIILDAYKSIQEDSRWAEGTIFQDMFYFGTQVWKTCRGGMDVYVVKRSNARYLDHKVAPAVADETSGGDGVKAATDEIKNEWQYGSDQCSGVVAAEMDVPSLLRKGASLPQSHLDQQDINKMAPLSHSPAMSTCVDYADQ